MGAAMFGLGRKKSTTTKAHQEPQPLEPGTRRLKMRFRGEVQGVGFRWTSQLVAERVGCTGWVRNESDGSVSMELQGTDDQISSWFGGLSGSYARFPIDYRIDEKEDVEPVEGEDGFEVRYR